MILQKGHWESDQGVFAWIHMSLCLLCTIFSFNLSCLVSYSSVFKYVSSVITICMINYHFTPQTSFLRVSISHLLTCCNGHFFKNTFLMVYRHSASLDLPSLLVTEFKLLCYQVYLKMYFNLRQITLMAISLQFWIKPKNNDRK